MKPGFYAVVGNSDYIRLNESRIPIWELFDEQPTGWLRSLTSRPTVMPDRQPMIWDCGAFGYRNLDIPQIRGRFVTAHLCIYQYARLSKPGDAIVAPDHLLVGNRIDERRKFNWQQAIEFIKLAALKLPDRMPMAVVHGLTLTERIQRAIELYEIGYRAVGIGGLVAGARNFHSSLIAIAATIEAIRQIDTNVHFHIFGLCSPRYARAFNQLGVSFDGSTYAKEAFIARNFLIHQGGRLVRYPAASNDTKAIAPRCCCRACNILRQYQIDPRYYGKSRQHDIGRLAHNLNQLLLAHNHNKSTLAASGLFQLQC
ncbi:hypothetical protein [Chroococcidiopsis thermalis]|uniref:tRNA-guanine(15) transglycosylase-like domain-containing protein n=1 Tax=Chroococcidiopsis thermalis (strain PCC 7203) TaxID=251229 RepID=K9U9G8_CHRTP|nr:hypothetical protein [Chroococcidiopsis thermalis]AFY91086.1 hypothetical protein Chro_5740 [Chroococcidiopsis thermalis PCC 7203]